MRYSRSSGELQGIVPGRSVMPSHPQFRHEDYRCHPCCSQLNLTVSSVRHFGAKSVVGPGWAMETHLSNTTSVVKTFLGVLTHMSLYHTPSLWVFLKCQHWKLFPPTVKTDAMETVELLLVFAACQNHCPLLDFHSNSYVNPGWPGISPLITEKLMNFIQANQNKNLEVWPKFLVGLLRVDVSSFSF